MALRIGVVGLGFMGSTHLEAYGGVHGIELAAVASSSAKKRSGDLTDVGGNLDRGAGTIDFGSATCYERAEDLIADPDVDAVDLCTPTHLHKPLALQALAAGKHVLVEKPMALTADDCDAMIAAARDADRVLMVAQVLRYFPEYVAAQEKLRSDDLGAVRGATFRRRCAAPAWGQWLKNPELSGGGAFDLLIHDFDYCQQLLGFPNAVSAVGCEDLDAGIDFVEARLEYAGGAPVIVSGGWHHPASFPFSMEFTILSDGGTLDYSSDRPGVRLHTAAGEVEELALPKVDGFVGEIQAFVEACMIGEPPVLCRPEDSAESVRIALAMKRSRSLGGESVPLDPG